jgi:hypothetical protein
MHNCIRIACLAAAGTMLVMAQDANRDVVFTKSDVREITHRLDKSTDEFKEDFDKAVEHSVLDDTRMEDRAKRRADELHDAAHKLKEVFDDKKDKNNPKVREQVDKTLAAGAEVNRIMLDHRFTDKLQRSWELIRSDLNALADVYGLSPL